MEEWHIPRKTTRNWSWVHYRLQTWTVEQLSSWHQTVLAAFLGFRKLLYSCTEGMYHSSTRPDTSLHVTQFYQAFCISTASNKRWGEKVWVWGYTLQVSPACRDGRGTPSFITICRRHGEKSGRRWTWKTKQFCGDKKTFARGKFQQRWQSQALIISQHYMTTIPGKFRCKNLWLS